MATAKAPQDRQPKAGYVRIDGKDWKIRPNLDDDWSYAEMVAASQAGGGKSIAAAVRSIQYALNDDEKAYDALKSEATVDGRVSSKAVQQIFERINEAVDPN